MQKSAAEYQAERDADRALTILLIVGASLFGVAVLVNFLRETLALSGPRPRNPWDT